MTRGGALRIILVGDTYLPERAAGAVRASELAQRWRERGQEVTVVTGNPHYPEGKIFPGYPNALFRRDEIHGVLVHRVFTVPYARSAIAKRIVNQLLFAFLPALVDHAGAADVVVATSPPLTIGVAGWLMARRRGVPLVFDVRDLYPASAVAAGVLREGPVLRAFEALEKIVYGRAARIVAVTGTLAREIVAQGVPESKVSVIPNGANTERFRPAPRDPAVRARYGIAEDAFLAGYVGLMGRMHGAEVIVEAAKRLQGDPRIHFLLVGGGSDRSRMEARAKEARLTNVTFGASIPQAEVPGVLCACDAGVATLADTPLTRGSLPVKAFEQMACALPVVLSGAGEFEEIVRGAGVGITVPPGDGEALARAVCALADDPAGARAMGEKGCAFVEARYDRRSLADAYLDILRQAAAAGPAGCAGSEEPDP